MHDKTVRRRRAVLILLVVLSLLLLTAYFGEAPSGRLHSVQRGFLTVISPIQEGANAALKPVRNLFGWFGSTLHAKGQLKEVQKTNAQLTRELIENQANQRGYSNLMKLYGLDNRLKISDYRPVTASVQAESPNIWYSTVNIDAGSSSGVQINDPVINDDGLVGKVTDVTSDFSQVSLITDSEVAVSAKVNATGVLGIIQPKVGEPNDLLLQYLPSGTDVKEGDFVVTSGTISNKGTSLFPPGIPIGQVTSVSSNGPIKSVNVHAQVDLHNLE
ncbi:MAG: rod shape-determining protein MreC, partial [Solirubrobacteraceae bacterium]